MSSDPASFFRSGGQLFWQLWLKLRRGQHCCPHEDQVSQSQSTQGQTPPSSRWLMQPLCQSCTSQRGRTWWDGCFSHQWHSWVHRSPSRGQQLPNGSYCSSREGHKDRGLRRVMSNESCCCHIFIYKNLLCLLFASTQRCMFPAVKRYSVLMLSSVGTAICLVQGLMRQCMCKMWVFHLWTSFLVC